MSASLSQAIKSNSILLITLAFCSSINGNFLISLEFPCLYSFHKKIPLRFKNSIKHSSSGSVENVMKGVINVFDEIYIFWKCGDWEISGMIGEHSSSSILDPLS